MTEEVGGACQPFPRAEKWQRLFLTGTAWHMPSVEELCELDLSIGKDEGRGLFDCFSVEISLVLQTG